ncbi:MAG: hydrogenase accessory protein HypB [Spirochaetae bacterium HGW-Spirochaetae-1]|jgi:hydrogenase nickel incorporation protein HypB|nr:MAG: hydrogenase accessory protein HypB [Spirochaetae bacterium HGW-Spirochaetae-1]
MEITVMKNIFGANAEKAGELRALLKQKKVLMVNLIGSPGAGKTTILEKTIEELNKKYKVAVIEGDVATDRDARRLQKYEVPITLINTDGACHLEALSIEQSLNGFDLDSLDMIFIENVGNLVCPAEFDIGEHAKIAIISVTEGDDKPAKYPLLFRESEAVILNKTDLEQYTNFNRASFLEDVKNLNASIPLFEMSCTKGPNLAPWIQWLEKRLQSL